MHIQTAPTWPDSAYIRPIRTESGGRRAWTHLAELRPPGQASCRGFVKHFPTDAPRGLFNEWFGYALMHALGVPQPACAIIRAPVPGLHGNPMYWAFVSCQPTPRFDGTPMAIYNVDKPDQYAELVKRLYACHAIAGLIAADQVAKNADRNLGNLVFTGPRTFVAIDHSDILGGHNWLTGDTYYTQEWALSKLIELVVPINSLAPSTRTAIVAAAEVAAEQYVTCQLALSDALNAHQHADTHAALAMVWWRAKDVGEWFKNRLQLLA